MNRQTILPMILMMMLIVLWTRYKGEQAKEIQKQTEIHRLDSLGQLAAKEKSRPAKGTASLGPVAGSQNPLNAQIGGSPLAANATDANGNPLAASALAGVDSGASAIPQRIVKVVTKTFDAIIDNQGARISELTLHDLEGRSVYHPRLIGGEGALTLAFDGEDLGERIWDCGNKTNLDSRSESASLECHTALRDGREVSRTYGFETGSNRIKHSVKVSGVVQSFSVNWKGGLDETEEMPTGKGMGLNSGFFSEVVFDNGSTVDRKSFAGRKEFNGDAGIIRWAGLRRKYVAVLLDFNRDVPYKIVAEGVKATGASSDAPNQYALTLAGRDWEPGAFDFDVAVQPLLYSEIKALDKGYEKILFTGYEWFFKADIWYPKLCGLVLSLLNVFHNWIPNYGIAIIMLTLLVRFITLPLTVGQTRMAARMAEHQPEIKKIQDKFKDDRQKAQLAIMDYYRQNGINPLAPVMGCLPMFLQMPVFISLFNVLGRAVELRQEGFFGWVKDLSHPDVVYAGLQIPYIFPVGITVLPFFMAGSMWVQMKMTIKDPNQKFMVWMMPVMMFVFSGSFPSGLVVYWTVSNVFTIAQTYVQTGNKKKRADRKAADIALGVVGGKANTTPRFDRKDARVKKDGKGKNA